jgi:extracellular factor (EF) 3-hydroxypalmitic acid methyl ester biosynthesis protein
METPAVKETMVLCRTNQGIEVRAGVMRLTRHHVVFEILDPNFVLRTSEVLEEFKIVLNDRTVYSGRAVISNLVNTGTVIVCEAALEQAGLDPTAVRPLIDAAQLQAGFEEFLRDWGKSYKIRADFKVLCADMQSFLADLRLWLEQVELGLRSLPNAERLQAERDAVRQLAPLTTPAFCALFEKFEMSARGIETELQPAHRAFCRRQLHPYLLCSPFMNRIYTKPLGYAGDYEMVGMILRDPCEGNSIFAMLLNVFILSQSPAVGHRNRVAFLVQNLIRETNRVAQQNRTAKIFNIGCGPAGEVHEFLREHELSNRSEFTLLDMNDETLERVGKSLNELKIKHHRHTNVKFIKKSVHQLLKQISKPKDWGEKYDLIYCAGLFDYLNDRVCQGLMNLFYELLAPGGKLVATNVDSYNPIRNIMEYVFEWHLIHRSGKEFAALAPEQAPADAVSVTAEASSSNIFIEVRKPE